MPRNVVFVAPFPTDATLRYARAVAKLHDVKLLGIVHVSLPRPDGEIFADVVRVSEPHSVHDVIAGVEELRRRHGEPYRIVGVQEELIVQVAQAAERFGVSGINVGHAELFREKARMKDTLRAAGLPVARHALITSVADAAKFAAEVGFPIVVKPPAGTGGRDTFRTVTLGALVRVVQRSAAGPRSPLLAEEMVGGQEHSFDTVTIGGHMLGCSFSQYRPGCLEVLENEWIQWACVLPREIDLPVYEKAKELGIAANRVLGVGSGLTHMEWFERTDGTLAIGEVGQRPPPPQLAHMTGLVHGIDIWRTWARAVVDRELDAPWERKFAAGCAFVRGTGRGRVIAVTGVRETHEAIGPWLVEAKLPRIGALKNDGYEGDGYFIVRHESTAKVRELIGAIVQTIKVHYTG